MSDVIFEAGDVVTCAFFGDEDFVLIESNIRDYPIQINFLDKDGKERSNCFTRDGRDYSYHTSPVLKLVRKKSKERELAESFMVKRLSDSFYLNVTDSYDSALDWIKLRGIPSWEYQIEKFYKIKE